MKKLLLLAFLALPFIGIAQETEKELVSRDESKLASFSTNTGTLIKKAFEPVGKIGPTAIEVIVLTNLAEGTKTKGLRIEKPTTSTYGGNHVASIDEDEIAGLLESISIMKEETAKPAPANYTEMTFKARSGFSFGCFVSKGVWAYSIQVDKYKSNSFQSIRPDDLANFEALIKEGQAKIKSII